jgi:hypothetical protein
MTSHLSRRAGVVFWVVLAVLAVGAFAGLFFSAFQPSPAVGQTVTVSATINKTISCSESTTTTSFGPLAAGSVNTSTPNVSSTMACANDLGGCTLSINDAGNGTTGGLYSAGTSHLIPSPNAAFAATATLVAGTEGFGINATTTAGTGAPFTLAANYAGSGATVGKLSTTPATLVSTTATTTGASVLVTHLVAISATTPAGSYTDTITYGCLAN